LRRDYLPQILLGQPQTALHSARNRNIDILFHYAACWMTEAFFFLLKELIGYSR
jgi:hypothetical protein